MFNFKDFLLWEQTSRDTVDVKKIYIDIAGDLVAGVLLSQIIFWFLPNQEGKTKLRVEKEGELWLAKEREDWWDECRISVKQFDRAISLLQEKNLVEKRIFMFNSKPTVHLRLNLSTLTKYLSEKIQGEAEQGGKTLLPKGEKRNCPKGKFHNRDNYRDNYRDSSIKDRNY